MEFTHYVQVECDAIGFARQIEDLDDGMVLCFLRLHAIKGIDFVAALAKDSLRPMEVIR